MKNMSNVLGAFADSAILFPLMALLTVKAGFSSPLILLSTGLAYLFSSRYFKIPMPVQPLKSIAVAAVTVGASFLEVRICGLLLGVFCIGMLYFRLDRFANRVPESIIHQLQLGLGILLVFQGLRSDYGWVAIFGSIALILYPRWKSIPLLGLLSTLGLLAAIIASERAPAETPLINLFSFDSRLRLGMIFGLLLPQLALTSANSILATRNVAERVYGSGASLVTVPRLLSSIGWGNIVSSIMGGMPYCHGSGGVTAHSRGGSTEAWSTTVIGWTLIALAVVQFLKGARELVIPATIVSILLISTGWFHVQLAKPTWEDKKKRKKLIISGLTVLVTRNLLWVLVVAVALEFYEHFQKPEDLDDSVS